MWLPGGGLTNHLFSSSFPSWESASGETSYHGVRATRSWSFPLKSSKELCAKSSYVDNLWLYPHLTPWLWPLQIYRDTTISWPVSELLVLGNYEKQVYCSKLSFGIVCYRVIDTNMMFNNNGFYEYIGLLLGILTKHILRYPLTLQTTFLKLPYSWHSKCDLNSTKLHCCEIRKGLERKTLLLSFLLAARLWRALDFWDSSKVPFS